MTIVSSVAACHTHSQLAESVGAFCEFEEKQLQAELTRLRAGIPLVTQPSNDAAWFVWGRALHLCLSVRRTDRPGAEQSLGQQFESTWLRARDLDAASKNSKQVLDELTVAAGLLRKINQLPIKE